MSQPKQPWEDPDVVAVFDELTPVFAGASLAGATPSMPHHAGVEAVLALG